MAELLLLPAEAATAGWLVAFFSTKLRIPRPLTLRWVTAIMASEYASARHLRAYLAAYQSQRAPLTTTVLQTQCTPQLLLRLIEDLVHEGVLTRQDGTAIEEHLLAKMTRTGAWIIARKKG